MQYTHTAFLCKQGSNGGKAAPKATAGKGVAHPGYQAPSLRADMFSSCGFICSSRWQVSRALPPSIVVGARARCWVDGRAQA